MLNLLVTQSEAVAGIRARNEFTIDMLGSTTARAWLNASVSRHASSAPFSFMFVFYTVRVAFVHGHE